MADLRVHSSTSNKFRLKLRSLSTGVGLTGLSSGSSGLIVSTITDNEATATAYTGSNLETVGTLGTFAAPTSGKARFREVDATNHPGLYEIQLADARFSVASARKIIISVSGATDLLDVDYEVQLTGFDPHDAVRLGLTALPNVASGNAGAILTSGTGTAQIAVSGGAVTTVTSVNTVNGIAGDAITANSIAAAAFTSAKFATGALQSATFADGFLTDAKVADDVTVRVGSWTTAGLAALFTSDSGETYADAVAGSVVKEIADNASGGGGGLTASDVWSHGTRTLTAATNITSTGGTITVSAGAVTVGTNNDKTGYRLSAAGVDDVWDEAMAELASVPGVTASFRSAVQWVFLLSRNKITQTSSTQTLRNDADNANVATAAVSDNGTTFTRGEWA